MYDAGYGLGRDERIYASVCGRVALKISIQLLREKFIAAAHGAQCSLIR